MTLAIDDRRQVANFLHSEIGFTAKTIAEIIGVNKETISLDVNPKRREQRRARQREADRHRKTSGTNADRGKGNILCRICDLPVAAHDAWCLDWEARSRSSGHLASHLKPLDDRGPLMTREQWKALDPSSPA